LLCRNSTPLFISRSRNQSQKNRTVAGQVISVNAEFVWEKSAFSKEDSTCFHTHTGAVSTWFYVVLVGGFSLPTPRQQLKHNPNPKSNAERSHSCGVP